MSNWFSKRKCSFPKPMFLSKRKKYKNNQIQLRGFKICFFKLPHMSAKTSINQSPKQLKLKSPRFRTVQAWWRPLGYLKSRAASVHCTCRPAPSAWWTCGRSSLTSQAQLKDKKKHIEKSGSVKDVCACSCRLVASITFFPPFKEHLKRNQKTSSLTITCIVPWFFLGCESQRLIDVRSVSESRGEIFFFCKNRKKKSAFSLIWSVYLSFVCLFF